MYNKCMANRTLTKSDKEFFTLVSQAAFANPFSEHRDEIDLKILPDPPAKDLVKIRPEVVNEVSKRIHELDEEKPAMLSDFSQADRQVIEHVFLFDVFHKFNLKFDELIIDQIDRETQPVSVPFATEALSDLVRRGFSAKTANRYFSLFYQIRRAFYFIEHSLIGRCLSMRRLRMNLWNNIFTHNILNYERYLWDRMEDFSTLILGPTGCGKGAAAAAIGRSGFIPFDEKKRTFAESFTNNFVQINLSQFPESLLESELFGHTKGAFTGAVSSHDGLFAICSRHGSIFLDEIGDINPHVQIKLLQVLQERIFSPVGSHKKLKFNGRVIAATNQPLAQLRREKKFRDDFYYRLCSDCIDVPSLQQRIAENHQELDVLIESVIQRITGRPSPELVKTVSGVIKKNLGPGYHWPGNVRELEQCIRRVIITHDYTGEEKRDSQNLLDNLCTGLAAGSLDAQQLLEAYCTLLYDKYGTYQQVADQTKLDHRTVKKYIRNYPATT